MHRMAVVLLAGLISVACSFGAAGAITASPTPLATLPSNPVTPGAAALTDGQIMNMDVKLIGKDPHPTVRLKNGEYQASGSASSPDYADVKLVPGSIARGDLNNDGKQDAAALLAENYGGTGVFVSVVAVLNAGGDPAPAGQYMLEDRAQLTTLSIRDGQIVFKGLVHAPNDAACCPSLPVTERFALTKGGLQQVDMSSTTPNGVERQITIEEPARGAPVTPGKVRVKGTCTVPPFENTLAYHVRDGTGKEWMQGQLPLDAGGTRFDTEIDLGPLPPGIVIRLEIIDVSAADGRPLAMDSVELVTR